MAQDSVAGAMVDCRVSVFWVVPVKGLVVLVVSALVE